MNTTLISYGNYGHYPAIELLLDAINRRRYTHRASQLLSIGFGQWSDIELALDKAIQSCLDSDINIGSHFKRVFITDMIDGQITTDWMLTNVGLRLILINGNSSKPIVRRARLKIVMKGPLY
ncbi:MAG: hypothetical protein ACI9J3_000222 [Parvicellaceae bacterium]|jgi:hypothetical protein